MTIPVLPYSTLVLSSPLIEEIRVRVQKQLVYLLIINKFNAMQTKQTTQVCIQVVDERIAAMIAITYTDSSVTLATRLDSSCPSTLTEYDTDVSSRKSHSAQGKVAFQNNGNNSLGI
jgi:hypothetical protein